MVINFMDHFYVKSTSKKKRGHVVKAKAGKRTKRVRDDDREDSNNVDSEENSDLLDDETESSDADSECDNVERSALPEGDRIGDYELPKVNKRTRQEWLQRLTTMSVTATRSLHIMSLVENVENIMHAYPETKVIIIQISHKFHDLAEKVISDHFSGTACPIYWFDGTMKGSSIIPDSDSFTILSAPLSCLSMMVVEEQASILQATPQVISLWAMVESVGRAVGSRAGPSAWPNSHCACLQALRR
ncbi:MAG: hypothetical protein MMC23_007454 [Stictis urceolatum]|nr:hypothetical protein [Stictis urceolata]